MEKEKMLIYPFDYEMIPALNQIIADGKYEISGVVSFPGWGYVGKDAGNIIYGNKNGIIIEDDFYTNLDKCDVVLICKTDNEIINPDTLLKKIQDAIEYKKNVVCFRKINDSDRKKLIKIAQQNDVYFKIYSNEVESSINYDMKRLLKLSDFNTPIVFVMGISENTNKYGVELGIHKKFKDDGYKSVLIGSKSYCSFFEDYAIPSFMYENSVMDYEKPLLFNKYVKNIEEKEKPDIFIIGVPGGVMPIDKKNTNRFGMLAYQISCGVSADVTVLCNHFNFFDEEYFEYMYPLLKYRFGKEIDCMYVNNSVIDLINEDVQGDLSFIHIFPEKVKQEIQKIARPNVFANITDMYQFILNTLEKYGTNTII